MTSTPDVQQPVIEASVVTTFSVENLKLKELLTPKLKGVTFDDVVSKINKIENNEVKNSLQNFLLQGNITASQKYVGMKVGSRYPDNKASGALDRRTLLRFTNKMFHLTGVDLLASKFIPEDVKEAYLKFSSGIYPTLGQPYLIISKTSSYMYLFTKDHKLMSIKKCLLGMDKGDQENMARTLGHDRTTPKGMYSAYSMKEPDPYYTGPDANGGDYIVLSPLEKQYKNIDGYTLGIHGYPVDDATTSINALTTDGADTRLSHGCVRTDINGIIYDYLSIKRKGGSRVYITADH